MTLKGVNLPIDAINKRPGIKLSFFAEPGALERILKEINKSSTMSLTDKAGL